MLLIRSKHKQHLKQVTWLSPREFLNEADFFWMWLILIRNWRNSTVLLLPFNWSTSLSLGASLFLSQVLAATAGVSNETSRTPTVFESLQMLTQYAHTSKQPVISRKRPIFELDPVRFNISEFVSIFWNFQSAVYEDPNVPKTPCIGKSKWSPYHDMANTQLSKCDK